MFIFGFCGYFVGVTQVTILKVITIISLIKLTEFLGKTNPNFFNMFINNIINKRNRDLLYQNELEHLLTKQMQNKTKRILISASRF